jgi:putative intracellular protease/amidase
MTAANEQIVTDHHMRVDAVSSDPEKVLIVVANPATATTVGWPVGFWGAELTHPYYELNERGVEAAMALLEDTPKLADVELDEHDAIMVAGGLAPMFSFRDNEQLRDAPRRFYESEKPTCIYCDGSKPWQSETLRAEPSEEP